ncbi:unnamed protein product [Nesidiocoris tenuis]|uniref:Uncharacterized protein n=1 Tax=Nesidiocoris tenuis TaxID=355587 RepID=A0A6H5GWV7_9HEMI|nr:unnamed protein product [Nesidiocoris tenuis]
MALQGSRKFQVLTGFEPSVLDCGPRTDNPSDNPYEVRKRRVIWDVGSNAYRNANDVRNEWLEVAAESGSTEEFCRNGGGAFKTDLCAPKPSPPRCERGRVQPFILQSRTHSKNHVTDGKICLKIDTGWLSASSDSKFDGEVVRAALVRMMEDFGDWRKDRVHEPIGPVYLLKSVRDQIQLFQEKRGILPEENNFVNLLGIIITQSGQAMYAVFTMFLALIPAFSIFIYAVHFILDRIVDIVTTKRKNELGLNYRRVYLMNGCQRPPDYSAYILDTTSRTRNPRWDRWTMSTIREKSSSYNAMQLVPSAVFPTHIPTIK